MKYPEYSQELLQMAKDDQHEARNMQRSLAVLPTETERKQYRQAIADNCHRRAARMLEILDIIGAPTVENIGSEAVEVVSLFALHSYIDEMKKVLTIYETEFERDPDSIYKQAIPPLTDRIMIVEQRKQKFGTNWMLTKDGQWFLVPVIDFANVNTLRARYGLGPISRLRNLSVGAKEYPLGKGPAEEGDQKELTDEEYAEYANHCLRK